MDSAGVADCEPLGCTAPTPSMLTSVALVVCQFFVVDWPLLIVLGSAVSDAVGAAGGGGGGGGGATFFLHPPQIRMALNAYNNIIHFSFGFTFSSLKVMRVIQSLVVSFATTSPDSHWAKWQTTND